MFVSPFAKTQDKPPITVQDNTKSIKTGLSLSPIIVHLFFYFNNTILPK
jgi:hypothetical protein